MASTTGAYRLGRDCQASGRLTLQHWLLKDLWDLIHPDIVKSWKQETPETPKRIVDVACGNAIWCIEVAESGFTKDLEVTGLDLSSAQFPPQEHWPANMTLGKWNMFDPPPMEYQESFDLVNLRVLVLTIEYGDPRPVLRNVLRLLKPGGIIQWLDFDLLAPLPGPTSSYARIWDFVAQTLGPRDHRWLHQIDSIFSEVGLQNVQKLVRVSSTAKRKHWVDMHMMAFQELLIAYPSPEFQQLWVECEKERTEQGVMPLWPSVLCMGRMPT